MTVVILEVYAVQESDFNDRGEHFAWTIRTAKITTELCVYHYFSS